MHLTINGHRVEVELQIGPSTRVQALDGSWSTYIQVTPTIVGGGPSGPPDPGEPMPIAEAA
ncbi:hypothetical protein SEA_AUBS_31 [Mycobacterium phage Aubs]|nr:hypothetical protein SEA_MADMEN_28 [Mycobacterium phage MadMen]UXE04503.1 hypothetical protein SEA_AUBS_31 [Mycobacterium phage Aubs]